MIKIEVLENKIFFRYGLRLVGPLDHAEFHQSLVRIADELHVPPVKVFIVYLEHRKMEMDNEPIPEIKDPITTDVLIHQTM